MNKIAKIKFERVVVRGEKRYSVLATDGVLKTKELPLEYVSGGRSFRLHDDSSIVFSDTYSPISVGDHLSENHYRNVISYMRECGERLTKINKKITEINHKGEFTVEI